MKPETIIKKNDYQWLLLKDLYDGNFINIKNRNYNTLPKKIHQIWLGSDIPEKYKKWGETWKQHNPDWEYKLWTDEDVNDVDIPNRSLFNSIKNMGQKSDFLRYHILNQFGGVYVDTDFECLKSFNDLTYANFLVGVGYPSKVELYIGLIGSIPNYPILLRVINSINSNDIGKLGWKNVFETTGTYFFTRIFFEMITKYIKGVVVLPPDYFYPFPNEKGHEHRNGRNYIKDCSYALHHWAVAWS